MDNQDNITISKYINGELTGAELVAFEKLLQEDEALKHEINFHKIVDETLTEDYQTINGIDEGERLEFEGILSKVMNGKEMVEELADKPISIVRKILPFAALAAAVALLLFLVPGLQNSNSAFADDFYKPYTYQADPTLGDVNEGIKAYQDKDYKTALDIISENLDGDLKLLLLKGNAEYNLTKYDEAILSFEEVKEKTGNQSFKNYANWYLALTYLKKENKNQATKLLKQLSEDSDYYAQSKVLLKKLE